MESERDNWQSQAVPQFTSPSEVAELFSTEKRELLLWLARAAISCYLEKGLILEYETEDPVLLVQAGVFVTLRVSRIHDGYTTAPAYQPDGRLRGCVGHIQAEYPLYEAVTEMAIKAATSDPRFPPMISSELDTVNIEISILTPLRQVSDLQEIEIGKHGLMIVEKRGRGVLLPKVPLSRGWGRKEFLQQLCRKAGLPKNCWPKSALLYKFTTIDFGELSGVN